MDELAYLAVVYRLGRDYHSGQWSKGYRLMCLADQRARREFSALDLGREWELLDSHSRVLNRSFRIEIARVLRKLRHYRHSL